MAMPALLNLQDLDLDGAPLPGESVMLTHLEVERQEEGTLWCWAAVALSIQRFFKDPNPFPSQCSLVTEVLKRDKPGLVCCPPNNNEIDCNVKHSTAIALEVVRKIDERIADPISFSAITGQIDDPINGRPICCSLVGQKKFGGHVVVLGGWEIRQGNKQWVHVQDPLGEEQGWQPYSEFRENQERHWDATYTTKNHGG